MALPSSGMISIGDIRDEAVSGGCYKAEASYSLGDLADVYNIPTNPDAMSEFYGLSCPIIVSVYANFYADPVNETTGAYALYYSINGGSDNLLVYGSSISTTCNAVGTITGLLSGDDLYIGWTNTNKLRAPYSFDGDKNTPTCPNTNNGDYCGTNNVGGLPLPATNLTSPISMAITISVAKGFFIAC